jgi:hypothetical protein
MRPSVSFSVHVHVPWIPLIGRRREGTHQLAATILLNSALGILHSSIDLSILATHFDPTIHASAVARHMLSPFGANHDTRLLTSQ